LLAEVVVAVMEVTPVQVLAQAPEAIFQDQ
jgi:hypothetical protein